jgi:signal transduction histidine kinase
MSHALNVVVASTIAYLAFLTGGYTSPYYAGFILMFIAMTMILPWGLQQTLSTGFIILIIHFSWNLFPAFLRGAVVDWPPVWNSVYFLTFSFAMAVVASVMLENSRRQIFTQTERDKIKNKKLQESRSKVNSLLKAKNVFLSNITHELKTPLSIVIGNAETILEERENLDSNVTKQLGSIHHAAFQLAMHVDRIVQISNVDDPEMQLTTDNYDYVGVVQNVSEVFEQKAKEEGKNYSTEMLCESLMVNMDIIRLEEVLNNLIQNAFKFTEPGDSIKITVGTDGRYAYTEVSDTGVGIPDDRLDKVFGRLYQGDDHLSKRHGGIGVGLYLCKRNIELHSGTMSVHSKLAKGTSFRFTLPLHLDQSVRVEKSAFGGQERRTTAPRRSSADRRMEERKKKFEYQQTLGLDALARMTGLDDIADYENRNAAGPSVLIVEDNLGMMKVVIDGLRNEYNLFLARSGFEALEKLGKHGNQISLILSDIMMPGMSGFELCGKVMERAEWKHIPMIFISALLGEEEQLHGYKLGATDYIIKPYNIKILKEKVAHWISRRQYEILLQNMSSSLEARVEALSRIRDVIIHEVNNPLQRIAGVEHFIEKLSGSFYDSS